MADRDRADIKLPDLDLITTLAQAAEKLTTPSLPKAQPIPASAKAGSRGRRTLTKGGQKPRDYTSHLAEDNPLAVLLAGISEAGTALDTGTAPARDLVSKLAAGIGNAVSSAKQTMEHGDWQQAPLTPLHEAAQKIPGALAGLLNGMPGMTAGNQAGWPAGAEVAAGSQLAGAPVVPPEPVINEVPVENVAPNAPPPERIASQVAAIVAQEKEEEGPSNIDTWLGFATALGSLGANIAGIGLGIGEQGRSLGALSRRFAQDQAKKNNQFKKEQKEAKTDDQYGALMQKHIGRLKNEADRQFVIDQFRISPSRAVSTLDGLIQSQSREELKLSKEMVKENENTFKPPRNVPKDVANLVTKLPNMKNVSVDNLRDLTWLTDGKGGNLKKAEALSFQSKVKEIFSTNPDLNTQRSFWPDALGGDGDVSDYDKLTRLLYMSYGGQGAVDDWQAKKAMRGFIAGGRQNMDPVPRKARGQVSGRKPDKSRASALQAELARRGGK